MTRFFHSFTMHPRRFLLVICLGYYLIGLALLLTVMRDDQMEATMRQRFTELPGSAPELLVAGFFIYGILPLLWPAGVMSILLN